MEKAVVDIIIPHLGCRADITDKAIRCLDSIREHSTLPYRVILIDNGTPEPEFQRIMVALSRVNHMLIRNRVNQGFIVATNQGLGLSHSEFVVLMNNDTEAAPQWLEKLRAPMLEDATIGLAGPRTTTPRSWQGRWTGNAGWIVLRSDISDKRAQNMLAFFCVMIRRKVIDQIGVLDESFGVGFGDDDMYCHRAIKAGWKLALAQDLVIPHHHRSTFHALYDVATVKEMQEKALAQFYRQRD